MTNPTNTVSKSRTRLLAAVASVAIAGAIGFGAVATGTAPVLADAVRVDAPQQMPSFADVVEKVSPAVVSVRVQEKIQPAADSGADMYQFQSPPGFDDLPDDHPLKKFFKEFRGDGNQMPGKRGGRPVIRGMRIAVSDILGWLAAGMSHAEIIADYPELTEDDIRAALAFAADRERRIVTA